MLANALLSFWRNLTCHKTYAALNIAGLSLGIATFLTLGLLTRYECTFDRDIPGAGSVYAVQDTFTLPGSPAMRTTGTSFAILPALRTDYPQIDLGSRVMTWGAMIHVDNLSVHQTITLVDPDFGRMLRYPMRRGTLAGALHGPSDIVLSESTARQLFGTPDAVGRHLHVNADNVTLVYTVTGVLAPMRDNQTHPPEAIALLPASLAGKIPDNWVTFSGALYVHIAHDADARRIAKTFPEFVARHAVPSGIAGTHTRDLLHLSLVRLPDQHFADFGAMGDDRATDRRVILALALVGVLALLAATINYVNLATARALLRAREVAMRKVMGASRRALAGQFLAEAVATVAIASVIGLALTEGAIPAIDALGGWRVAIDYPWALGMMIAVVAIVGLGSGTYPAFVLASYDPGRVLASAKMPSGGRMGHRVRTLLVAIQFAFAVGFAICTLVMQRETAYLRDADRGYDRNGLMVLPGTTDEAAADHQRSILDAMRAIPGVSSATLSSAAPGVALAGDNFAPVSLPGHIGHPLSLRMIWTGSDFFRTFGITPIAGRLFDSQHGTDDFGALATASGDAGIVIDTHALAALGISDARNALGQTLTMKFPGVNRTLTVIGVVPPMRLLTGRDSGAPQIFVRQMQKVAGGILTLRIHSSDPATVRAQIARVWADQAAGAPADARSVDDLIADTVRPDEKRSELFAIGAGLAIFVACLGLYGLASFNATRRLHEIGIRKTLGASTRSVLTLLVGQFLRPIVAGCAIAWPVSWVVMRSYLAGFEQRISLSALYFVGVTLVAVLLCIATVLGQTVRLASVEPARALRQ